MGNSNTPGLSMTTTPSPYGGLVRQWSQPFDLDLQSVSGDSFVGDDDLAHTVPGITGNRLKLDDLVDDVSPEVRRFSSILSTDSGYADDKDCSTYDIVAKLRKQRSCADEYQQEINMAAHNGSDIVKKGRSLTSHTLLKDCLAGHSKSSQETCSDAANLEDHNARCPSHLTPAINTPTKDTYSYITIDDCISNSDDCDTHTSPRVLLIEDSLTSSTSSQHPGFWEGKISRSALGTQRMLTIHDTPGHVQNFVAMLCAPQEDLVGFTLPFHRELERWGFRIFLQERDLLAGGNVFEELSTVVEERCNGKIIIILSRHYPASGECQFLTHFARHLDPDARRRAIVPVLIDRHVLDLPNVLTGISLIRYNHAVRTGWLKRKMIEAIVA